MPYSTESSTSPNPDATQPIHRLRGIVYTALFAALFIAFSWVQIPLGFSPVPVTLQTLAVMLAGGLLGATYGFWSIAIVVLLTAVGLPLLEGRGGLSTVFGPTGGYIWMFPISALLIGFVSDRLFRGSGRLNAWRIAVLAAAIALFGVVFPYVAGVPWLAYKLDISFAKAMAAGCYPFIPGDTIKGVAAVAIIALLRPLLPGLRGRG